MNDECRVVMSVIFWSVVIIISGIPGTSTVYYDSMMDDELIEYPGYELICEPLCVLRCNRNLEYYSNSDVRIQNFTGIFLIKREGETRFRKLFENSSTQKVIF